MMTMMMMTMMMVMAMMMMVVLGPPSRHGTCGSCAMMLLHEQLRNECCTSGCGLQQQGS